MVWEGQSPILRDEDAVQTLKRRNVTFIRPRVKPSLNIKLLELAVIDKLSETIHHAPIQTRVIFIHGPVNKIEVPPKKPGASAISSHVLEFIQE